MPQLANPFRFRYALIGTVLSLGTWLATIVLISFDPVPKGIDLADGRNTFHEHCEACHILDKGITLQHGPNFYEIGKVAGTRKPGLTAAQYILESILNPRAFAAPQNWSGMPKSVAHELSPDSIRNVVAYLAGRGARPDYDEILRLEIPDMRQAASTRVIRRDQMELGEAALRGRGECLNCHSMYRSAEYQVFAPALFGAGLVDEQNIRESVVDPNKELPPAHVDIKIVLKNGKLVLGKLISRTAEKLVLVARNEQNQPEPQEVAMAEIETEDGQPMIANSEKSPMPTGLDQTLTAEELEAVITMIRQLN
jgi:mono/diheme cytochrome c family protein